MAEKDERTLKMKQEYIRLHFDEGKSPKEIAEMFQLTPTTVYTVLYEISEETGIPRSALLDQPHEKPVSYDRQFEPVKRVEPKRALDFYKKSLAVLDEQLTEVRAVLNELEKEENEGCK